MTARPHRIRVPWDDAVDVYADPRAAATRSGKRRDVAAAWRRLQYLRARGFRMDDAGTWSYDWTQDLIGLDRRRTWHEDGPVSEATAEKLRAYVATGATSPGRSFP